MSFNDTSTGSRDGAGDVGGGGGGERATYTPFLPCDITNGHPFPSWSKKSNIPHKKMVRQVNSDEKDLRNLPAPSRF